MRDLPGRLTDTGRVGRIAGTGLVLLWPLLAPTVRPQSRVVGTLAWVAIPGALLLMASQRLYVPTRVFLYLSYFAAIVGCVVVEGAWPRRGYRYQLALLLLAGSIYGGYGLRRQLPDYRNAMRRDHAMRTAYRWLTTQPGTRVLLSASYYELYFLHYALVENRPLLLHSDPVPGQPYDLAIHAHDDAPLPVWVAPPRCQPLYTDQFIAISGRRQ